VTPYRTIGGSIYNPTDTRQRNKMKTMYTRTRVPNNTLSTGSSDIYGISLCPHAPDRGGFGMERIIKRVATKIMVPKLIISTTYDSPLSGNYRTKTILKYTLLGFSYRMLYHTTSNGEGRPGRSRCRCSQLRVVSPW